MVGVTGSAITNYEKETSHPKETVMYKLFEALNVDANYLFQDVVNVPKKNNDVTLSEFDVIKKYRKLDDLGKEIVGLILDKEVKRTEQLKEAEENKSSYVREDQIIYLPEMYSRFSAGTGQYNSDSGYEMAEVPYSPEAAQANYLITVSGDSMEPDFSDGDRVFIKSMPDIEIGEIGAWQVNGDLFIKEKGNGELISVNPDYDNIKIGEYDEVSCLGKVLGKVNN
jgi:repressor LexA